MLFSYGAAAAVFAGLVSAQVPTSNTATGTSDIAKAQATAITSSSTSHVEGKAFDRFVVIWLENTDYTDAFNDRRPSKILTYPSYTDRWYQRTSHRWPRRASGLPTNMQSLTQ